MLFPVQQARGLPHTYHDEYVARRAYREGYYTEVDRRLAARVEREVKRFAAGRRIRMLEVGGGTGHFFDRVAEHASLYVNVEPAPLDLGEREVRRLGRDGYLCLRCSGESLPLDDRSVDLVLALASLDHIPDPDAAIAEAARVLDPAGQLIVILNNRGSWWKRLLGGTGYLRRHLESVARHHTVQWTFDEIVDHLSRRFETVRARSLIFVPFVPYMWRVGVPLTEAVLASPMRKYGASVIAVGSVPCQRPLA